MDRDELIEETKESYEEAKAQQNELKAAIAEEHAGQAVETEVVLAGDIEATVRTRLEGSTMNALRDVESQIEAFEAGDGSFDGVETVADRCAQALADVTVSPEYDKSFFYGVYEELGLVALGNLVERVFSGIEEEVDELKGAVDGFRSE